ncbi:MAG: hypothetical protein AAGC44_06840 [Planctomycetota bacterium]
MMRLTPIHPALLLLVAGFGLLLGGCAAQRPSLESIQPEWSHHDTHAEPEPVSSANQQAWSQFAANQILVNSDGSQVAKAAEAQRQER